MTAKTKQIIFALIVIAIAFFAFRTFFGPVESPDATLGVGNANTVTFVDGQAILILLNKLKDVQLDENIFSDKVFLSLQSFERPITPQILRRENPFAPIGTDGAVLSLPADVL